MSYIGNTPSTQNFQPAIDYFNGDGTTLSFTLSRSVASSAQVQIVVNNVPQAPNSAFTVVGSVITFTSAPSAGAGNIYVYYTTLNSQTIVPGPGTVGIAEINWGAVNPKITGKAVAMSIVFGG